MALHQCNSPNWVRDSTRNDTRSEKNGQERFLYLYRNRPESVPANNRLSLERNVQQDICKYLMASECDKQP